MKLPLPKLLQKIAIFFAIILAGTSCQENTEDTPPPERPNIIWIVSEDNSPFLGAYQDSIVQTPNLDALAAKSVTYDFAFANAPVCAPSRSTLITGMFASSLGTHHMRCQNPVPGFVHFFPYYLKQAGYYTTNRNKKDYNIADQEGVWDNDGWWNLADAFKGRKEGQPFFFMYNTWMSHEDKLHGDDSRSREYYRNSYEALTGQEVSQEEIDGLLERPEAVPVPPYHPPTPEVREDWKRYYSRMRMMDSEVGLLLDKLEEQGLLKNSIVFYFSDHGGVLARSKRFPFETGLKVPLIVHFPERYQTLAPSPKGTRVDRIVSFVDFAPTVLSLAGIKPPDHLQGSAFLGEYKGPEPAYAYGFRGRMDERYDMVRTVRNKHFRYIRNYMPHRIYGQHITFLWKAQNTQSWQEAYQQGQTNQAQSAFWEPKPMEELYYIPEDPVNAHNVANLLEYQDELAELRAACDSIEMTVKDAGFYPEAEMMRQMKAGSAFDFMRSDSAAWQAVHQAAKVATGKGLVKLDSLGWMLAHENPAIRYWGATGCAIEGEQAASLKPSLLQLLDDPSPSVQIATAEALYQLGEKTAAIGKLGMLLETYRKEMEQYGEEPPKYAMEDMVLLHALNVLTVLGQDAFVFEEEYRLIAESPWNYSNRAASHLLSQAEM